MKLTIATIATVVFGFIVGMFYGRYVPALLNGERVLHTIDETRLPEVTVPSCRDARSQRWAVPVREKQSGEVHSLCVNENGDIVDRVWPSEAWRLIQPELDEIPWVRFPDTITINKDGQCQARYAEGHPLNHLMRGVAHEFSTWPIAASGVCYSMDDPARSVPLVNEERERLRKALADDLARRQAQGVYP